MNLFLFSGLELNFFFWLSAFTSIMKPAIHIVSPIRPIVPISTLSLLEIAVRAAAAVKDTHSPCIIHAFKYLMNEGLRLSKRPSLPTSCTLLKRKIPSLNAQTIISVPSRNDLMSKLLVRSKAIVVVRT